MHQAVQSRRVGWRRRLRRDATGVLVAGAAALGVIQFVPESRALERRQGTPVAAEASPDAFGRSGAVRTLFALPGAPLQYPLTVSDARGLRYRWVSVDGRRPASPALPLRGAAVAAPVEPGFYRLALQTADSVETIVAAPLVAVMTPFRQKIGDMLNGYRIGTYVAERLGTRPAGLDGFVEVWPEALALRVTDHLTLGDFITHDARQENVWPKYVALSPRLLDKLELVIAEVERERGSRGALAVAVQSGFRTPAYNARVSRAARDSRHQHGDAADVAIDANADGRLTATDGRLVAAAVERVERAHPELAGGLGLYTSRRYRTPYVHIDTRGARARWRG